MAPLQLNKYGLPIVNKLTQGTSEKWAFVGGDLGGVAETTVESVNDGKLAAWSIHCYLQSLHGFEINTAPKLPMFYTPIDYVCNLFSLILCFLIII